jgi:hypothetical protein
VPRDSIRDALASDWFDTYARVGYAAKGLSFGLVGFLMLRVARGDRSERADFAGVMEEMSAQPLLAAMLLLMSAGFVGYAAWRLVQGVADVEGEGRDLVGLTKRGSYIAVGLLYAGFAIYALGILFGWSTDEGAVQDWTRRLMQWPGGGLPPGVIGADILAGSLAELWFAVSRRFQVELGRDDIGRFERACILCSGGIGHMGRSLVYTALGVFAIRAALEYDPDEARGVADTIRELADQPYGSWLVGFAAAGFIAYGVYYGLLARHHHLPNEGLIRGRRREDRAPS